MSPSVAAPKRPLNLTLNVDPDVIRLVSSDANLTLPRAAPAEPSSQDPVRGPAGVSVRLPLGTPREVDAAGAAVNVWVALDRVVVAADVPRAALAAAITLQADGTFATADLDAAGGYLVTPLVAALQRTTARHRSAAKGLVARLFVDERVPYATLARVVHSVGSAGLDELDFVGRPPASSKDLRGYDLRALYRLLANIKKSHPHDQTLNLALRPESPWQRSGKLGPSGAAGGWSRSCCANPPDCSLQFKRLARREIGQDPRHP